MASGYNWVVVKVVYLGNKAGLAGNWWDLIFIAELQGSGIGCFPQPGFWKWSKGP